MTAHTWDTIDALVAEHKTELKAMTSHKQINAFAEDHDLMTKNDFPKLKFSLRKIGVHYNKLRDAAQADYDDHLAEVAADLDKTDEPLPTITLWAAASEGDDGSGCFAVVDEDDTPLWYGNFFADDRIRIPGDIVSAEQSAAEKAVWLASKAMDAADVDRGHVIITTTCPHLETKALKSAGAKHDLKVTVTLDDDDMRAVDMADTPGYKRWQDNDLASLVHTGKN